MTWVYFHVYQEAHRLSKSDGSKAHQDLKEASSEELGHKYLSPNMNHQRESR